MIGRAVATGAIRSDTKTVARMHALSRQIRGDLWARWMALAQKRALIWWRNRKVTPGLAARFTTAGIPFYGFGPRLRKPASIPPYYLNSERLRDALMKRMPKTARATLRAGNVVTVLKYGGLTLNALMAVKFRQIQSVTTTTTTTTATYNVASYTRPTGPVAGYSMTRPIRSTMTTVTRGGKTHGQLFGEFGRDRPVIEARVQIELRKILRASAYDKRTGLIKSSATSAQEMAAA